ncbi:MAG: DUF2442 domain-containing protein [bacterium]
MRENKPIKVNPLDNYFLEIEFSNGEIRTFDCNPYINGDWFSELHDINKFRSVRISGNTVEWSTGQDLCPDCLYENSVLIH